MIVTRFAGYSRREFAIADLTRSFASSIALLPRPTICQPGSPFVMSLSTSTRWPSKPIGATEKTFLTVPMITLVNHTSLRL